MTKKAIITAIAIGVGACVVGFLIYENRHDIQQDIASLNVPAAVTSDELNDYWDNDNSELTGAEYLETIEEWMKETEYESPWEQGSALSNDNVEVADVELGGTVAVDARVQSFNLAVPFTSQAPHANWDLPYQETCEEASVLMALSFLDSDMVDLSTPELADKAILELVDFQVAQYDLYLDTTVAEVKRFAEDRYPEYLFDIVTNPTEEDIELAIMNGSPVLLPAAGRQLGNPFFSGNGPLYHMMVVRGFTENSFVVNDPGTRNGEAYVYKREVLMSAMGDWNDGDPANGQKAVIIVSKKL